MTRKYIHPMCNRTRLGTDQQGATLAIVLIFLVLVTLVGVTAMTTTTMEERMSGNVKDRNLAFQAAEAALRDAKLDISGAVVAGGNIAVLRSPAISGATGFGNSSTPGTCSSTGLCRPANIEDTYDTPSNASEFLSQSFTGAPSVAYGTYTDAEPLDNVFMQPHYLIQLVKVRNDKEPDKTLFWYRITAHGYGARFETHVTLQEVVKK